MALFAVPKKCEAEVCVPGKRMLLSAHGRADMQRMEMVQKTPAYTPDIAAFPDDPLLGCLLILARIHNRCASAEALTVGLPLINHRLTPQLFSRAAEQAGLSAKVVKRDLPYISDLGLPAVLVLQNGDACVLVRREETCVTVVLPESGTGGTLAWLPVVAIPLVICFGIAVQFPTVSGGQANRRGGGVSAEHSGGEFGGA